MNIASREAKDLKTKLRIHVAETMVCDAHFVTELLTYHICEQVICSGVREILFPPIDFPFQVNDTQTTPLMIL